MLFLHPMWSSESHRIGKQRCTPAGYALHVVAELIGFVGLLLLLAVPVVFFWKGFAGTFETSTWRFLMVPFGLGIVSEVSFQFSWWLAIRKGFQYDSARNEASWWEAGERQTYPFPPERDTASEEAG